jgi:hypothetical protein
MVASGAGSDGACLTLGHLATLNLPYIHGSLIENAVAAIAAIMV